MHRAAARAWRNDNHRGQPSNPPRSVCSAWVVPPVACCRQASHAPIAAAAAGVRALAEALWQ
ncbi:hypothetical protein XocBAI15_09525 [Xanthomonas oryzae pv. oryzicola]|nr:hypothetical protein BE73_05445 [Xanthomonas oryzae pv. oryzicola]AKO05464.1 hypothetical protein ACU16_16465 [Xanthomonas oryzae pv. oryzicola]AKO09360.1 hypothetical protein ACU17_16335 [Xanthomonas oryzae pv. oryzicola]OWB26104.1 hypothetical protein XocBAI20_15495 [Xanthomonas oryzae pv. oryzicola]OWB27287.1 hypothetical protein XocBAI15_09525 [Xanthomonas oryzae pv. oryzicola]